MFFFFFQFHTGEILRDFKPPYKKASSASGGRKLSISQTRVCYGLIYLTLFVLWLTTKSSYRQVPRQEYCGVGSVSPWFSQPRSLVSHLQLLNWQMYSLLLSCRGSPHRSWGQLWFSLIYLAASTIICV